MSHFWKDLGRGLLYAVPVMLVAGLGAREVVRLRTANQELEARRLQAERALARAEERLSAGHRRDDQSLAARLRAAADAAENQGAAEERLSRVVEFLKQEVSTAESTIEALRRGGGTRWRRTPPREASRNPPRNFSAKFPASTARSRRCVRIPGRKDKTDRSESGVGNRRAHGCFGGASEAGLSGWPTRWSTAC